MPLTRRILLNAHHVPADVPHVAEETRDYSGVTSFQFDDLNKFQLKHAVFTRHGGVSRSPYDSLNTSDSCGDNPEDVGKNLKIIEGHFGKHPLISMKQCHGRNIQVVRKDELSSLTGPLDGTDALITDIENLPIMVKLADCQGVILFDPIRRVIANVHCGWRGNVLNILGATVKKMVSAFGCRASEIKAAIGPSLGPCCAEFSGYENSFPKEFYPFMVRKDYFDLWEISRWQLKSAGLRDQNIEVAGICTRCRTDLFYSYRAEGVTGRFAMVAMLG